MFEALQEFVRKPPGMIPDRSYLHVLEAASPRKTRGDVSWVVSTPRYAAPALQFDPSSLARFESAIPFSFNQGDAVTDRSLIDRGACSLHRRSLDRFVGQ